MSGRLRAGIQANLPTVTTAQPHRPDEVSPNDDDTNRIGVVIGRRATGHRASPVQGRPCNLVSVEMHTHENRQGIHNNSHEPGTATAPQFPPTLFVFNAASIAKPHAIETLEAEMKSLDIDIAVISETHLKSKHKDGVVSMPGYSIHRKDRVGRRAGGVAVYVKSHYHSRKCNFERPDDDTYELLWVRTDHADARTMIVGALYHPPKPIYDSNKLLGYIERTVDKITDEIPGAVIVIAGDLNQLPEETLVGKTGFIPIVKQPTRGAAFLDRIYTSVPCYTSVQVVTSAVKSDHKAVIARHSGRVKLSKPERKIRTCRLVNPSRNARFMSHLPAIEFNVADQNTSVQDDFNRFYQILVQTLNQFYPETKVTISARDPEYMTPAIKAKLREKNKLMRQWRLEEANQLAKRIGSDIARSNSKLQNLTKSNSKSDSITNKDLWSAVRKLTNRSKEDPIALGIDAEMLNDHYANISSDSDYISPTLKKLENFEKNTFTEYQVFHILDRLKPTATGLDGIPAWFLRLGAPIFAKVMTDLFNKSIANGVVPSQWKRAYIRPVPKVQTALIIGQFQSRR